MKPIKIGIAGLGNVGEEVAYQLIKGFRVQKNLFQIELVAVSAKSKNKKIKLDINNLKFFTFAKPWKFYNIFNTF